jgi:hypothetical protein
MIRYTSLLLFFFCINNPVIANESFELSNEDYQHINKTALDYNLCLQQNAIKQLDDYADIREVTAHAVNLCDQTLKELKNKLGNKANSDQYSGLERHIKNRAIKSLLPLLMFEKSSRQAAASENQ